MEQQFNQQNQQSSSNINEEKPLQGKGYYPYDLLSTKKFNEMQSKINSMDLERPVESKMTDERPLHSLKTNASNKLNCMQYDDQPVGSSKDKIIMEEYPPGYNPIGDGNAESLNEEDKKDKGPLSERLKSKVWKTRQNAYEEMEQLFISKNANDPEFNEFCEDFIKFLGDANPGAQEKALKAIEVWFAKTKSCNEKIELGDFVKALIEKCLTGKPSLKPSALEIICILFEGGGSSSKDAVINAVHQSIQNKNQKVSCASISLVCDLLQNFGVKRLDFLKPFFPEIEKQITNSTSALIKKECTNFYREAYKWMGQSIQSLIQNLKKQQVEELQKFFTEWELKPMQPLRTDNNGAQSSTTSSNPNGGGGQGQIMMIDAYDLAEPEDIFTKYNESWAERVLALPKWNEKKEQLDAFLKAAQAIRLANTNFHPSVTLIKKLLIDPNVNIVTCALKMAGQLASGLRKSFYVTAKNLFGQLANKLRDIKKNVVDESARSLQIFLQYCISIEDVVEDVSGILSDKSAGAKQSCICLLEKHLQMQVQPLQQQEEQNNAQVVGKKNFGGSNGGGGNSVWNNNKNGLKTLLPTIKKLIDDSSAEVRDRTLQLLARMKYCFGEEFFGNLLMDVNQAKMAKLNQIIQQISGNSGSSTSGIGSGGGQTPKSNRSTPSKLTCGFQQQNMAVTQNAINKKLDFKHLSPGKKNNDAGIVTGKGATNPLNSRNQGAGNTNKNNQNQNNNKQLGGGSSSGGKKQAASINTIELENDEDILTEGSSQLVADECRNKLQDAGAVDSQVLGKLELSKSWKEKSEGLQGIDAVKLLGIQGLVQQKPIEMLFHLLRHSFKDWKESNALLLKELFALINRILDQVLPTIENRTEHQQFSKKSISLIALFLSERLSDPKFTEPINEVTKKLGIVVMPASITVSIVFQTLKNKLGSIANNSNTKQLTELCNFLSRQVELYTLKYQPLKEILSVAKNCVVSTFPNVKSAALALLKTLYSHKGKDILAAIQDLPPQSLKSIQPEIEKAQILPENEKEIRLQKLQQQKLLPPSTVIEEFNAQQQGNSSNNSLMNQPRVDISADVNKIIKKITDSNWKVRKEGLDSVECIIRTATASGRISLSGLQELFSSLKARLGDCNKSLIRQSMQILTKLVESIGSSVRAQCKIMLPSLIANLQDKERFIRQETLLCLDAWAASVGADQVLNQCPPFLVQDSPELKLELLQWITKYMDFLEKCEIKLFFSPILNCLIGKHKDVRAISEQILEKMISFLTVQPFYQEMKDFKPAVVQQLRVILEKYSAIVINSGVSQPGSGNKMQIEYQQQGIIEEANLPKQQQNPPSGNTRNQVQTQYQQPQSQPQQLSAPTTVQNNIQQMPHAAQKELRLKSEMKQPWPLDSLDDDLVAELSQQFRNVGFPEELCRKLFSYDFYKNIEAAQYVTENLEQAQEISDLFLKWAFLRTWGNGNALLAESVLAMLGKVTSCLVAEKYFLLEFEIQIFLSVIKNYIFMHEGRERRDTLHCLMEKSKLIIEQTKVIRFWIDCLEANAMIGSTPAEPCMYGLLETVFSQSIPHCELSRLSKLTSVYEHPTFLPTIRRVYGEQQLKQLGFNFALVKPQQQTATILQPNQLQTQLKQPSQFLNSGNATSNNNASNNNAIVKKCSELGSISPSLASLQLLQNTQSSTTQGLIISNEPSKVIVEIIPLTPQQYAQKIQQNIGILQNLTSSCQESMTALKEINELCTSEYADNVLQQSSFILDSMSQVIVQQFRDRRSQKTGSSPAASKSQNSDYILFFMQTMNKLMHFDNVVQSLDNAVLYRLTESTYTQLLYEGENRDDPKSVEPITKQLNSNMLRLLEASNLNSMLNTLFGMLISMRRQVEYSKQMGILIKCILKLVRTLSQNIGKIDVQRLLLHFHQYIQEFKNKVDDVGMRTIKTIVQELINVLGEAKINEYYKVIETHENKDFFIQYWIQTYVRQQNIASPNSASVANGQGVCNIKGQSAGIITETTSTNIQTLATSINNNNSPISNLDQRRFSHIRTVTQNLDNCMKQIVEALEKNEQDEAALLQLKDICLKNPNFSWSSYFNQNMGKLIEDVGLKLKDMLTSHSKSPQPSKQLQQQQVQMINDDQKLTIPQMQMPIQVQSISQQQKQEEIMTCSSNNQNQPQSINIQSQQNLPLHLQHQQQEKQALTENQVIIEEIRSQSKNQDQGSIKLMDYQKSNQKINELKMRYGQLMKSNEKNKDKTPFSENTDQLNMNVSPIIKEKISKLNDLKQQLNNNANLINTSPAATTVTAAYLQQQQQQHFNGLF